MVFFFQKIKVHIFCYVIHSIKAALKVTLVNLLLTNYIILWLKINLFT